MSLPLNRYVNIDSGVIGDQQVNERNLGLRIFSSHSKLIAQGIQTFHSLEDFTHFFDSFPADPMGMPDYPYAEYHRTAQYFRFVSKTSRRPNQISFYPYDPSLGSPSLTGGDLTSTLEQIKVVNDGEIRIVGSDFTYIVPSIDLSTASSFDNVASILQTTLRGVMFSSKLVLPQAEVTYQAEHNRFFILSGHPVNEELTWVDFAAPAYIGGNVTSTLAQIQAVTAGDFTISDTETTYTINAIDFSGASSLSEVATTLQTAMRLVTGLANAFVQYDMGNNHFIIDTGLNNPASRDLVWTDGAETPLALLALTSDGGGMELPDGRPSQTPLKLLALTEAEGATKSSGDPIESPSEAFMKANAENDNFGSFLFAPALRAADHAAVAEANDTLNVKYMYLVGGIKENIMNLVDELSGFSGTALTLVGSVTGEATTFIDQIPAEVLATTDYNGVGTVQNYMYQQQATVNNDTGIVVDTDAANTLDANRVNYYGRTQFAGSPVGFYQRGVLFGSPTAARDMNTYANEIWFKNSAETAIFNLLLAKRVPANRTGVATVLSVLNDVIINAQNNGTISVGRTLNAEQKAIVLDLTDDVHAVTKLNSDGYWVTASIREVDNESVLNYLLIYAKDNIIRKVDGVHSLI